MYTEKDAVQKFLEGDYGSESQLTLGSESQARAHEENGNLDMAAIHRLPIDDARHLIFMMLGHSPDVVRECWKILLNRELPR